MTSGGMLGFIGSSNGGTKMRAGKRRLLVLVVDDLREILGVELGCDVRDSGWLNM